MTKLNTISISYNRILSVLRYCVCINHHFLKFVVVIALMSFSFVFGQEDNNRSPAKYRPRTRTIVPLIPQPAVKIEFRRMRFGRPKLVYLLFDVRLRNDQKSPRWLLLPSNLGSGHSAIGEKGGIDTLEVFSPRGKGHVVVGRFLGTGGFNALLLPPGAAVRLRLFPISYWGDPPDNLEIEIVIAKELTIDGDKIEKWFGNSPLSSVKADIAEDAENPMWMRTAKRTKDNKEVVPVIEEDQRLRLQVALGNKKSP